MPNSLPESIAEHLGQHPSSLYQGTQKAQEPKAISQSFAVEDATEIEPESFHVDKLEELEEPKDSTKLVRNIPSSEALERQEDTSDPTPEDGLNTPQRKQSDQHPELENLRSALETSLASPGGVEMDEEPKHNGDLSIHKNNDELHEQPSVIKAEFPSKGPANDSGHVSSISFARTVPQEMDWGEEDDVDPEWNIQRTDADPFKMMAQSARTNSFPQVPNLATNDSSFPPALTETSIASDNDQLSRDLFGEVDANTDDFFSKVAEPESTNETEAEDRQEDWFNNHGGQAIEDDFERSYGGDAVDASDFEARYEEGVPLVGHTEQGPLGASNPEPESAALFGDDDPSQEDDFFSGIGEAKTTSSDSFHQKQPSLERKSTMQVMNSINFQALGQQSSFGESPIMASEVQLAAKQEDVPATKNSEPSEEDLAARWKAALAGDEFLEDDELLEDDAVPAPSSLDPATFFGSDDEGFLEDDEPSAESLLEQHPVPASDKANGHARTNSAGRYLPPNAAQPQVPAHQTSNPYKPAAPLLGDFSAQAPLPTSSPYGQGYGGPAPGSIPSYGAMQEPSRPDIPKSQSFADKSKGGYSSPYDLPMEVVKPRKRVSMQHMSRNYNNAAPPPVVAPPRSSSMYAQAPPLSKGPQGPPPSQGSNPSLSPQVPFQQPHQASQQPPSLPPTAAQPGAPPLRSKASFFEELPMSTKHKPPGRYTPQPVSPVVDPRATQGNGPYPQPVDHRTTDYSQVIEQQVSQGNPPYPHAGSMTAPPQSHAPYSQPPPPAQGLVAPPKTSPYANLPSGPPQPVIQSSRYSPAPSHHTSVNTPPPVVQGRYATAPPNVRQNPNQIVGAHVPAPPPATFPHQPRTSSPLAHFERSQDHHPYSGSGSSTGGVAMLRRGSSGLEHVSRAPSLPITEEVDEQGANDSLGYGSTTYSDVKPQHQVQPNYTPSGIPPVSQHAQEYQHAGSLSPSKRSVSGHLPGEQYGSISQGFVPPQRSQTQSPGRVMLGPRADISLAEPYQRPVSVQGPASPKHTSQGYSSMATSMGQGAPRTRPRGFSQGYNYIAPTDGRENDPLQRWKGGPIFAWGVGGTVVTSFPKEVPRYGMGQTQPQIMVSPGEVKIKTLKELYPLEERLASFPGPLKSKSKKKETVAWLTAGIDILDRENEHLRRLPSLSHEDRRREERVILWKILRVMIENDGILEGNEAVNIAVRAVLSPGIDDDANDALPQYATGAELSGIVRAAGSTTQAEPVNPAAVNELRKHLLRGEREKAVWEAVDKRLWAHALLISNTLSKDLYKQVAQEFVQKEVKSIGDNTESLAALYEVFAGNFEESVDELVPPSARAGFQMVSTSGSGPSKSSIDGLDRWRETLGLVLSNRSENDNQAINALGNLLSGYGRAEAAHVCFLFGRGHSSFGGVDDPLSNIVLVGSDHHRERYEFDKELEPILLSEVYEFGLTLSNTSNMPLSMPHLSVYKLQHATILAQVGQREKALQYCEAIATSITSQTRRSPYHHALLVAALDDLSKRLKQSPKDESSSWISKPSIDKVSTSVWSKFNKFVAGDENDAASGPGSEAGSDMGPFARIAGGTPTISRSPSNGELYGSYSGGNTNGPVQAPSAARAASRYAPGAGYTPPGSSHEPPVSMYGSPPQQSSFGQRRSFEDRRSSEEPRAPTREASMGSYHGGPLHTAQQSQVSTPAYNPYASQGQSSHNQSRPHSPTFEPPRISTMHESPRSIPNSERPTPAARYGTPDHYNSNGAQNYTSRAPSEFEPQSASSYGPPSAGGYQTPSNAGYEPPSSSGYEPPPSSGYEPPSSSGYEPPSNNSYDPPSYEPAVMNDEPDSPIDTRPKKKSFMDDDYDDSPSTQSREKTKAEKDREAEEAFRKAAEADGKKIQLDNRDHADIFLAQKDAPAAAPKKGWGLGGWFGGSKKEAAAEMNQPNKPIKAKLGEESSFVYDPDLKRWINKKGGKDETPDRQTATPPPPKGPPRTATSSPAIGPTSVPRPNMPPSYGSAPPTQQRSASAGVPVGQSGGSSENLAVPPPMSRTVSSGSAGGPPIVPPSRPSTSMSNASSIDDLLGPPAARKGGAKKAKKGRGYIDVMGDKK